MPYVIKPRIDTKKHRNVLLRVLNGGDLPAGHADCDGMEIRTEEDLAEAMNELYSTKLARKLR